MKVIETCTHGTNLEFLDVFHGMHLRTCVEVLPLGGSDTCDHVWTSPRSYVQRCLLQQLPDHPLLGLSNVLIQYSGEFSWMKAIDTCTHGTNLEFLDVFHGMHLRTCGEVLPMGGSDTCNHVWTSSRSYVQQRLLQHLPDHPLLGLSIVLLSLVCLCWMMTANKRMRIDDGEGWDCKGVCCSYH
jgi:hypothetical protein